MGMVLDASAADGRRVELDGDMRWTSQVGPSSDPSQTLARTEDEMNRKGKLTCERGRGGSHNQRAWFNTSMARIMNDMKISRGEKQSASQETRTSLVWPVQDFRMLSMISMLYSLASCLTMRERLSEGLKAVGAVRMFFWSFGG
uniref:Uncharacterized protein n=1 Tax=Zea mays TaxID=4577 RepID=A0A804QD24_MAIZE